MRVMLISDQPLTSIGLRNVLRRVEPAVDVYYAVSFAEGTRALGEQRFDAVVLDLDTHDARRLAAAARLRRQWPDLALALLAESAPAEEAVSASEFGVVPFLLKTAPHREIETALGRVVRRSAAAQPLRLTA
jgi:two-component system response regulator NreC